MIGSMLYANKENYAFLDRLIDKKRDELLASMPEYVNTRLEFDDAPDAICEVEVSDDFKDRYIDDIIGEFSLPKPGEAEMLPLITYASAGDLKLLMSADGLTDEAKCAYMHCADQMYQTMYLRYVADHEFENWLKRDRSFEDYAYESYYKNEREKDYAYAS